VPYKVPKPVLLAAKEVFVTSPIKPTWEELARRFGVHRNTLVRHAKLEGWYEERERFQQQVQMAAARHKEQELKAEAAGKTIGARQAETIRLADQMQKAVAAVFARLANSIVRDTSEEDWEKLPLEAKLRLLTSVPRAWAEIVKLKELLEGRSTERLEIGTASTIELSPEEEEVLDALWDKLNELRQHSLN